MKHDQFSAALIHWAHINIVHVETSVGQSSEQADFTSEFVGWFSLRTHVNRMGQRSVESRGFSPGAPSSSHRESWQGGLG